MSEIIIDKVFPIDIALFLCLRMLCDIYEIMLHYKPTFLGRIRKADPMHPNVVT